MQQRISYLCGLWMSQSFRRRKPPSRPCSPTLSIRGRRRRGAVDAGFTGAGRRLGGRTSVLEPIETRIASLSTWSRRLGNALLPQSAVLGLPSPCIPTRCPLVPGYRLGHLRQRNARHLPPKHTRRALRSALTSSTFFPSTRSSKSRYTSDR